MSEDLVSMVNAIIAIPNLGFMVQDQVFLAAQTLHNGSYFQRDLVETFIPVSPSLPDTGGPLQIVLPENFRKWHYLRPQALDGSLGSMLRSVLPQDIFKHYDRTRTIWQMPEVYYNAGRNCNIFMSYPVRGFLLGYFSSPVKSILLSSDDWLCQNYTDAVVWRACARIYLIHENDAMFQKYDRLASQAAESLYRLEPQYDAEEII